MCPRLAADVADEETQRQLTELRDSIAATARIRDAHQRRLYVLQEQAAQYGIDAPAHLVTETVDLGVKIKAADEQIREFRRLAVRLEQAPQSALTLPDADAVIPVLLPAVVDQRLREMGATVDRMGDMFAHLQELIDLSREESREWRNTERAARQGGMRDHHGEHRTQRIILVGGAVVLLILAIGVVLIAVKVF